MVIVNLNVNIIPRILGFGNKNYVLRKLFLCTTTLHSTAQITFFYYHNDSILLIKISASRKNSDTKLFYAKISNFCNTVPISFHIIIHISFFECFYSLKLRLDSECEPQSLHCALHTHHPFWPCPSNSDTVPKCCTSLLLKTNKSRQQGSFSITTRLWKQFSYI